MTTPKETRTDRLLRAGATSIGVWADALRHTESGLAEAQEKLATYESNEQELGATMKVLGKALNPTAELTVGGVLEMAQALVERYEAAQAKCTRLENELNTACRQHEGCAEKLLKAQAEIAALKRGEYICQKCGLRKDGECEKGDF